MAHVVDGPLHRPAGGGAVTPTTALITGLVLGGIGGCAGTVAFVVWLDRRLDEATGNFVASLWRHR